MQELEIEFKNLLTRKQFEQLNNDLFHSVNEVVQTNLYIDTSHMALREKRLLLRLRDIEGTLEMTLKEQTKDGVLETTGYVDQMIKNDIFIERNYIPDEIIRELDAHQINSTDLRIYGALKTARKEIQYKGGTLVLDFSSYLNKEDFELEYEVPDFSRHEDFLELLDTYNIHRQQQTTKSERFYQAYEEMRHY